MPGSKDGSQQGGWETGFEAKEIELLDKLGAAGYTFGGGSDIGAGTTSIGIGLDPEIRRITAEEALAALPIANDDGEIVEGYDIGTNEGTGQFELGYDGPLDNRFEAVVNALVRLVNPEERERLPKIIVTQCLGETCVNWSGTACRPYHDLLEADGESGGTDLPPFKDEPTFALYGHVCTGGEKPALVAQHAVTYAPVPIGKLLALSGWYGDMPLAISAEDRNPVVVETLVSSEDAQGYND